MHLKLFVQSNCGHATIVTYNLLQYTKKNDYLIPKLKFKNQEL